MIKLSNILSEIKIIGNNPEERFILKRDEIVNFVRKCMENEHGPPDELLEWVTDVIDILKKHFSFEYKNFLELNKQELSKVPKDNLIKLSAITDKYLKKIKSKYNIDEIRIVKPFPNPEVVYKFDQEQLKKFRSKSLERYKRNPYDSYRRKFELPITYYYGLENNTEFNSIKGMKNWDPFILSKYYDYIKKFNSENI